MPPYKPVVSKSQSRALFHLADIGQISEADAKGKTAAADFKSLPEHVHHSAPPPPHAPARSRALVALRHIGPKHIGPHAKHPPAEPYRP